MSAETTSPASNQSTTDAVRNITEAGRDLFNAGERIAENLDTLERRVEHATDWRAWVADRPWTAVGAAVLAGVLLWRVLRE
jgi:ElaB/YqjD/DUF883 family membrane-anchored ribosome-binding protein